MPAVTPAVTAPSRALRLRRPRGLPDGFLFCLVVYLVTRIPVVLGVLVYLRRHPEDDLSRLSAKWDGWWYATIADHGYSASLRSPATGLRDWHHAYSDWAFFPGYPLVIRVTTTLTGLPTMVAAVALSAVLGFLAVLAMHGLGSAVGGRDVGRTSALLLAVWPGSAIFLQPYSEALFTAAATTALLALLRERWLLAGVLTAVATASRPTGTALIAAAGVVAVLRLVRDRDPRPLLAPVLGTLGVASFVVLGWLRTGDPLVWRHAENLWEQRLDVGQELIEVWRRSVGQPRVAMQNLIGQEELAVSLIQIGGTLALLVAIVAVVRVRHRLDLPSAVYAALTLATIVAYSAVGPRPRTLLALIPAFVWVALAWRPRVVRVVSAVLFVPLLGVVTYAWLWRVTP